MFGPSDPRSYSRVCTVTDSNNIASVAYNPEDFMMMVTFKNGTVYRYTRVTYDEFGKVVSAPSVGKAFLRYIKPKQAEKIR